MDGHDVIFIEDGMSAEILATIDTKYINDVDIICQIIGNIFENNNFTRKHNLIIKYGYKPM